jgi:prephenate dehydratase
VRVGYLGPQGTFSYEALVAALAGEPEAVPVALPSLWETIAAVRDGGVDRSLVPIENSLEGSVNTTLDALAEPDSGLTIVGEVVHPVHHCLIAGREMALGEISELISHPHAPGQCARFLHAELPHVRITPAASTAEAVRVVTGEPGAHAALGPRAAAEIYGATVLRAGVEDAQDNETRFVWLAPRGTWVGSTGPWKTAVVFWESDEDVPGWLVRCLSELAFRGINLTRIESRPRKDRLGRYRFFADLHGGAHQAHIAEGLAALRRQAGEMHVLGSFPAAV